MKKRRAQGNQERSEQIRGLLDDLQFVMDHSMVLDNAPSIFRKLLTIERFLQRELTDVTGSGLPTPEEVVPANYRLHQQDNLVSEPVIAAEIVGLGTRQCAMTVFARFPEHPELPDENEFVVGFEDNDDRFETVEFQRVDSETGTHLDTPLGALAGLYAALLETCHDELDQWRINAAHLEDIALEAS
jgi:hypothetical protein